LRLTHRPLSLPTHHTTPTHSNNGLAFVAQLGSAAVAAHWGQVQATAACYYGRRDGQEQAQGWCRELPRGVCHLWGTTYGFLDPFSNLAYVFDVACFGQRPEHFTTTTPEDSEGSAASSPADGGSVSQQQLLDDSARAAAALDVGEDGAEGGRLDGSMQALLLSGVMNGEGGASGSQLELSSSSGCPLVVGRQLGTQVRLSGPALLDSGIASMRLTEALFALRRPGAILRFFFRLLRWEGGQQQAAAAMEADWERRVFHDAFLQIGASMRAVMVADGSRPVGREEKVEEGGRGVLVVGEGGIESATAVAVLADVGVVEVEGEGEHGLDLDGEADGTDATIVVGDGGVGGGLAAAAAAVAAIGSVVEEGEGLIFPASPSLSSSSFPSSYDLRTDSESGEEDQSQEELREQMQEQQQQLLPFSPTRSSSTSHEDEMIEEEEEEEEQQQLQQQQQLLPSSPTRSTTTSHDSEIGDFEALIEEEEEEEEEQQQQRGEETAAVSPTGSTTTSHEESSDNILEEEKGEEEGEEGEEVAGPVPAQGFVLSGSDELEENNEDGNEQQQQQQQQQHSEPKHVAQARAYHQQKELMKSLQQHYHNERKQGIEQQQQQQ